MKFKRLISALMACAMVITLLPAAMFVSATDTSGYEFKYVLYSMTAKGEDSGTSDNNLYCRVYFYKESAVKSAYAETKKDDEYIEFLIGNSGDNREAKGSSPKTKYAPWRVSGYRIGNRSTNAYEAHALKLYVEVYDGDTRVASYQIGETKYPKGSSDNTQGKWLDSSGQHSPTYYVSVGSGSGPQTRKPTGIDGWEEFGRTAYIDPGYTGGDTITVELPGTLPGDRYNNLFGGSYNMFDWSEAGRLSFEVSGTAVDGSTVNEKTLTADDVDAFERITVNDTYEYVSGYKIDKQKLVSYMNKKGINKLEITSTLYFPWWTFDDTNFKSEEAVEKYGRIGGDKFQKTYTIYRNAFEVWNVKLSPKDGELLERNADNKYFNAGTTTIQADVDVYYYNNDTSTISSENRNNTWNHFGKGFLDGKEIKFAETPRLQIGDDENNYISAKSDTATFNSTSDFSLEFELPEGAVDSEDVGLTLILESAHFEADGQKYYLTDTQYDYTSPPSGDVRTKGDASYLVSTHKADNIMPTANFTFDEDEPSVNGWRKRAVLDYTVSEDLYTGNEASDIATLSYRLRSKDNPDVYYNITNKDGTGRMIKGEHIATKSSGSTIIVANADGQKEIEGVLELVDTTDIAGNTATAVIDGIKLDNLAPRVSVVKNEEGKASDGSKSVKYTFTAEDASKSANVYYVFVQSTDAMPEFNSDNVEDGSGEIENLFGKWAYVSQNDDGTTNGTALLKIENGNFFDGRMYWFAEDGLGNKTDISSVDVSIYNENTEYDIFAEGDTGYPKKDYEINIISEGNTIYWRWQYPDGSGAVSDYRKYTSAAEVGSGTQKNRKGETVVLDGPCTLEFKIKTSAGTENTYTKQFVFDNSEPDVGFTNANSGTYRSAQTLTATANDASGIKSATAQLLHFDESEVEGHNEFALTVNDGLLSDKVTVTNVPAGAYRLRVTAVDNNGFETTEISNPFYIRNEVPELSLSTDSDNTFDGAPLFAENEYQMNISVKESFNYATGTQVLWYRAADSTQEYGAWINGGVMNVADDGFELDLAAETPVKLIEGINQIYIQTIIAAEGVDPANLTGQGIIATEMLTMYYDASSPQYRLVLEDEHTNGTISGKLYLSDNLDGDLTVDLNGLDNSITVSETDSINVLDFIVSDNVDGTVYAEDAAGNRTEIPIKISGVDHVAPVVSASDAVHNVSGERTFALLAVTISDVEPGNVEFALIPKAEANRAMDADGNIKDKYFEEPQVENGDASALDYTVVESVAALWENEENISYNITVKGLNGEYCIGVKASDSVGNTGYTILSDNVLSPKDAKAKISGYTVAPKIAYGRATAKIQFSVPVTVLPQNMITDSEEANLESVRKYQGEHSIEYSLSITDAGRYTLYVSDELGRCSKLTLEIKDDDVIFSDAIEIDAYTAIIYDEYVFNPETTDYEGYVIHGENRVDETKLVSPPNVKYINEETGDTADGCLVMIIEAPEGYKLYPGDVFAENEYAFVDGVRFYKWLCDDLYLTDTGYTRLIFELWNIYYEEYTDPSDEDSFYRVYPEISERAADYYLVTDESFADKTQWISGTAVTGGIDNSPPQCEAVVSPVVVRDEEGEPTSYTLGNVTLDGTFSDPQTGVKSFEFGVGIDSDDDGYEDKWEEFTISLNDENGNPIDYMTTPYFYKDENGLFEVTLYSDTDPYSVKSVHFVCYDNVWITPYVINGADDWGYFSIGSEGDLRVDYINKSDISDSDYTVSYQYIDENGEWKAVEDGTFYKEAKAVVTPTESGLERGVYVYNNAQSSEKLLDSFDRSFTFVLSDKYGYMHEVPVELSNFDTTPGTINVELSVNGKTNQPVPVTITVSDEESGVGTVALARGNENISLTDAGNGVYTGYVSNIGNHTITFTDKAGNIAQKVFMVADIDKTLPEIAEVEYNETERTSKTVSAAIKYTKPNVTLTKVEPASSLTTDDYTVDYANSTLRFRESGSLSVWFRDDYGNENSDVVTVDNIYKTPPALEAVAAIADDKMSVDVSFEKATSDTGAYIDAERELSEIMVSYNGIVRSAEDENGEKAVFTFTDNGKYTFKVYDAEGVSSYLTLEITDIDKTAPKITQVRWSYEYDVLENGEWIKKKAEGTRDVENETGYRIATDINPVTNQNVDVTVVTDSETSIMGDPNSEKSTEHTLTYQENGMYIFNMEKANGLSDSYGFDVAVIDKTPPVIELAAQELIFYENASANPVQYSKDLIASPGEAFKAYDVFGGMIDLTDRVTIDYGSFNPDDITQNTFDRTKPYTIIYTVSDDAHNTVEAKLTIRLVGYFDTIALINGSLPDYAGRKEVNGDKITVSLKNFSGVSYAKVEKGIKTMGQMKKTGTVLAETSSGSGEYEFTPDAEGWYTILVQTDKRDYFNLQVYIWK